MTRQPAPHDRRFAATAARLSRLLLVAIGASLLLGCAMLPRSTRLGGTGLSPKQEFELGRSYEADGDYDAALRWYGYAAKNLPDEPDPQIAIGNVHFSRGEHAEAEQAYRRALAIDPNRAPALNNLAWLLYTVDGDLAEAEALARRATALAPDNPDYADTLAHILTPDHSP